MHESTGQLLLLSVTRLSTTGLDLFEGVPVARAHAHDGIHARQERREPLVEMTGYRADRQAHYKAFSSKNEEAV